MVPADPQHLPDDIDALKAMIAAAHAEIAELKIINATADERIARLTSIVAMLQRAQYGTRSERLRHDPLDDEQMAVTQPNQVWATDITYIPMARGFVYLAAVVDWFSRRVLSWRLSISMDVSFCIEAVEEGSWLDMVRPKSSTQIRAANLQTWPHRPAAREQQRHQHGRSRSMARQRLCRTALAVHQIRGGVPCGPVIPSPTPAPRSAAIWPSTMLGGPTRALTGRPQTLPTSIR